MCEYITYFLTVMVLGFLVSLSIGGWDGTKSFYQGIGTATVSDGGIDKVEYFINDKPDYSGKGTPIPGASGQSPLVFTFSIPATVLKSGDNSICIDAMSSRRVWGTPTCITATK